MGAPPLDLQPQTEVQRLGNRCSSRPRLELLSRPHLHLALLR